MQPAARLGGRKPHGPIKFCCCCCSCGAGIEVCWACASITISKSLFCQKFPAASHTLTVRLHVRPTDHNPHCVTVLSLTRYRHIVRVLLSCAWWRRRTIPCTSAFCRALWGSHHTRHHPYTSIPLPAQELRIARQSLEILKVVVQSSGRAMVSVSRQVGGPAELLVEVGALPVDELGAVTDEFVLGVLLPDLSKRGAP